MRSYLILLVVLIVSGSMQSARAQTAPAASGASAAAQTRSAPRVNRVIRVVGIDDKKTVLYLLDEDPNTVGRSLHGAVLVTSGDVILTVPKLNPLRTQVSATWTAVDDPNAAVITKLIEAIASVPGTIRPDTKNTLDMSFLSTRDRLAQADAMPECQALTDARRDVDNLTDLLFNNSATSASAINNSLTRWRKEIDDHPGREGVGSAAAMMVEKAGEIRADIKKAEQLVEKIRELANGQSTPDTSHVNRLQDLAARSRSSVPTLPAKATDKQKNDRARLDQQADAAEEAADEAAALLDCEQHARMIYQLVQLTDPAQRIGRLKQLTSNLAELADILDKQYVKPPAQWNKGTDFVMALNVAPTAQKGQSFTVKQSSVSFKVDDEVLQVVREEAGAATFELRKFRRWVPELGIGATFSFISRPKYGTAQNAAGETIVARIKDEPVAFDPAVMVNFLPWGDDGATPFIQLGAATSIENPALFIGPGWRVPAPSGGIAIGLGVMLGWVKDLQTLSEGAVVSGTKAIEDDLGFDPQPKARFYLNIQYKF